MMSPNLILGVHTQQKKSDSLLFYFYLCIWGRKERQKWFLCPKCVQCPRCPEEGFASPETEVIGDCELPAVGIGN